MERIVFGENFERFDINNVIITEAELDGKMKTSEIKYNGKKDIYFKLPSRTNPGFRERHQFGIDQKRHCDNTLRGLDISYQLNDDSDESIVKFVKELEDLVTDNFEKCDNFSEEETEEIQNSETLVKPLISTMKEGDKILNLKLVTRGQGRRMKCDTKIFVRDKECREKYLDYVQSRGECALAVRVDGVKWGKYGESEYHAFIQLSVAQLRLILYTDIDDDVLI